METVITGEKIYEKIKTLKLNWKNYYIEEILYEKWVDEYPHSEAHGGGASQLRLIEKFPREEKHN